MNKIKYLKGECAHCGGHIEFPADAIGMTTDCPHCSKPTDLLLVTPPEQPAISRKTIVWTSIAVLILALGLVGALVALNLAKKRLAARNQPPPVTASPTNAPPPKPEDPAAKAGFQVSAVTLDKEKTAGTSEKDKSPKSSLVYAVGTVTNPSAKKRFGVRVELDLFNAADKKVGTATDYQAVIEPNGEWRFKALVVVPKAASAKLAAIKEDQ
jgi:flagellar basal body-associated protein FliL